MWCYSLGSSFIKRINIPFERKSVPTRRDEVYCWEQRAEKSKYIFSLGCWKVQGDTFYLSHWAENYRLVCQSSSSSPSPRTRLLARLFHGNILYTSLTMTLLETFKRFLRLESNFLVPCWAVFVVLVIGSVVVREASVVKGSALVTVSSLARKWNNIIFVTTSNI